MFDNDNQWRALGRFTVLAIRQEVHPPITFSVAIFAFLLGQDITLGDVAFDIEDLYNRLRVETNRGRKTIVKEIISAEYSNARIPGLNALRQGFKEILPSSLICDAITAQELVSLMSGDKTMNVYPNAKLHSIEEWRSEVENTLVRLSPDSQVYFKAKDASEAEIDIKAQAFKTFEVALRVSGSDTEYDRVVFDTGSRRTWLYHSSGPAKFHVHAPGEEEHVLYGDGTKRCLTGPTEAELTLGRNRWRRSFGGCPTSLDEASRTNGLLGASP